MHPHQHLYRYPVSAKSNRITPSCRGASLLMLFILLQHVQPHLCNPHESRSYQKRHPNGEVAFSRAADSLPADKRTLISAVGNGGSVSQPEEIFSANDQLESNYDEYPVSTRTDH